MCGFVAIAEVGGARADANAVARMTATLEHRGPDDTGFFAEGAVAFGFRRLAILDLSSAAHQPMESRDGAAVLVFNGAIFNYLELRAELQSLGHEFRSTGDTEVLLAAYRQWGRECVHRLNGMWAFLVYDRSRRALFGARDRFGIKPLYWTRAGERYLFASEIKAFAASGFYRPAPNLPVLADYLVCGHDSAGDEAEETFYAGVFQTPPGTAFELRLDGRMEPWRYWRLDEEAVEWSGDAAEEFAALFEDAVRIRLRSDVPVGVMLSGGLDSTSIACSAARQRDGPAAPLEMFSFHSPDFDETALVDETARATGGTLHRLELRDAVAWDRWRRMCWHFDQPVQSATPLVGFELNALARARGVKVLLNGQGADEALAGYPEYFRWYWQSLLRRGRWRDAWGAIRAYARDHEPAALALLFRTVRALVQARLRRLPAYRRLAAGRRRRRIADNPWFDVALLAHVRPAATLAPEVPLSGFLRESVERGPLPLYLRGEDRNSMAHGIEARLPFLDHRLVAFCFALPDEMKVRGALNKYVLREAMRGRIPERVRTRVAKFGFPTQQREWVARSWYEPLRDLLASRETRERGIYRIEALREGLERHRRGEVDLAPLFTSFAMVEFWFRDCLVAQSAVAASPPSP